MAREWQGFQKAIFKHDSANRVFLGSSNRKDSAMAQETEIRLRPDGSIDTAYYMQIGRHMRSQQAHHLARQLKPAAHQPRRRWFGRLIAAARHQGA
jgi:hypothetical protein